MAAFSEVLSGYEVNTSGGSIIVPDIWKQGRSVFGGMQGALALRAMRERVPAGMPVRTVQMTFVGPLQGDRIDFDVKILRQGKNAIHVEARMLEGDSVLAVALAVFGSARSSRISRKFEYQEVENPAPKNVRYFPRLTPEFTRQFQARWLKGGFPFSGQAEPFGVIELGMPDETLSSEYHVMAMADYAPPIGLCMLSEPAPGSSLTWMIEFLVDDVAGMPLENWRLDAEMTAAGDGYTSQQCLLWSPRKEAVALSRQSMVIYG